MKTVAASPSLPALLPAGPAGVSCEGGHAAAAVLTAARASTLPPAPPPPLGRSIATGSPARARSERSSVAESPAAPVARRARRAVLHGGPLRAASVRDSDADCASRSGAGPVRRPGACTPRNVLCPLSGARLRLRRGTANACHATGRRERRAPAREGDPTCPVPAIPSAARRDQLSEPVPRRAGARWWRTRGLSVASSLVAPHQRWPNQMEPPRRARRFPRRVARRASTTPSDAHRR